MKKKILLIDDDLDILEFISYNLRKAGYDVYTESNGTSGIKKSLEIIPDLILLDIMMPEKDGIEVCQELRSFQELKKTIIILLSARGEEFSQLAGYQAGANDYIVKIIKPKVLISKINALFQLTTQNEYKEVLEFGNLVINKELFFVTKEGKNLSLTKKEFDLLYLLASNIKKVFKREEILEQVWGNDVVVCERIIDVYIRRIREKIGNDFIQTLSGVGYKFDYTK